MTGSAYEVLGVVYSLLLFSKGGVQGGKGPAPEPHPWLAGGWRISPGGEFRIVTNNISCTWRGPKRTLCWMAVQEASWGSVWAPPGALLGRKMGPKWPQDGPQMGPKWAGGGTGWPQDDG